MNGIVSPRAALTALALFMGFSTSAVVVDNFSLLDHEGKFHELYYYSDADAVVLIVQGNACPIIRNALDDIRGIRDEFADENVVFLMLNANLQDDRASIQAEATEFGIDMPVLVDESQLVARGLGVTRTAEAFVIDPSNWELAYRGPINDRLGYERQKAEADAHYVVDAVRAVKDGVEVAIEPAGVKGCLINIEQAATDVSFVADVAPVLEKRCMNCHVPSGIGPWPMSSYEIVKGFAPMMREVLRTNRMPPWDADPHVGEWWNDRGITTDEKRLLVDWIENGAPRGEGEDPLGSIVSRIESERTSVAWPLGEPDMVIEVPAFEVPATGVVDYQNYQIEADIDEGIWVKGIDVKPGNTNVVHHLLLGTIAPESSGRGGVNENYIGGYAPGITAFMLPEDTGSYIEAGSRFAVQMHYTPYGKAAIDNTQVALYLLDEKPKYVARHGVVIDFTVSIPPHEKNHEERAYIEFDQDAELYSVLPHSHFRGRSSTFELESPDGERELLLSVPHYDFNWQTEYIFAKPLAVQAGSKLIHKTMYDNSTQNFANPDADRTVTWGLQSWDEMLYGAFLFRWAAETTSNPTHNEERFQTAQTVGYLDEDMDGGVEQSEISEQMQKRFAAAFQHFDANANEALEVDELFNYQKYLAQRRAQREAVAASED